MVENELGKFEIKKTDKAEAFHCDRCNKDKKAKITVSYTNLENKEILLCNGCYGYLLSTIKK